MLFVKLSPRSLRQGYPLSCIPLSKLFNRCKAQISPSRLSFERTLDSRQNKKRTITIFYSNAW